MKRLIRLIRLTWHWWCWQDIHESIATIKFLLPRDTEIDPWVGDQELDPEVENFGRIGYQNWMDEVMEGL